MTRNDGKAGLFLTSSESVRRDGISRDHSGAARILPVHREPTTGLQLNSSGYLIIILGLQGIYFMSKSKNFPCPAPSCTMDTVAETLWGGLVLVLKQLSCCRYTHTLSCPVCVQLQSLISLCCCLPTEIRNTTSTAFLRVWMSHRAAVMQYRRLPPVVPLKTIHWN